MCRTREELALEKIRVTFEPTPNPQSLKFVSDRPISLRSQMFENIDSAEPSPLARKLFGFPWAKSVFIGPDFLTLSKEDWVEWDVIAQPLCQIIQEHLELGLPVLEGTAEESTAQDSDLVKKIRHILDQEIRPAVAMDGGDVVFRKYEDGVVFLSMQGACSGCPSASYTLKEGIESRLKERLPQIRGVSSV